MSKPPPTHEVKSPCVNVCRMRPPNGEGQALCEGCHRTLDEIAAWSTLSDEAKRTVLRALPQRRSALRLSSPPPTA